MTKAVRFDLPVRESAAHAIKLTAHYANQTAGRVGEPKRVIRALRNPSESRHPTAGQFLYWCRVRTTKPFFDPTSTTLTLLPRRRHWSVNVQRADPAAAEPFHGSIGLLGYCQPSGKYRHPHQIGHSPPVERSAY